MERTVTLLVSRHGHIIGATGAAHPSVPRILWAVGSIDFRSVHCRDLVASLPYSESTLRRRFRDAHGIPLARFLCWHAIVRSLRLLIDDPFSDLGRVANEVGYATVPGLVRAWRRETGARPGRAATVLKGTGWCGREPIGLLPAARLIDRAVQQEGRGSGVVSESQRRRDFDAVLRVLDGGIVPEPSRYTFNQ